MTGTLCTSVVAKMNFTWGGGSSRVFKNAFQAAFVVLARWLYALGLRRYSAFGG